MEIYELVKEFTYELFLDCKYITLCKDTMKLTSSQQFCEVSKFESRTNIINHLVEGDVIVLLNLRLLGLV